MWICFCQSVFVSVCVCVSVCVFMYVCVLYVWVCIIWVLLRGMGRYRAHVASGPAHIYEVQATICRFWRIYFKKPLYFIIFFFNDLRLNLGKPQSGHFVASNEDFPEFKLLKVVRASVVGYLTIYHLMAPPTRVLPNTPRLPYYVWGLNWGRGEWTSHHLYLSPLPSSSLSLKQNGPGQGIYYNIAPMCQQIYSCHPLW